jgi:site-specific DNA-cytosine methylase
MTLGCRDGGENAAWVLDQRQVGGNGTPVPPRPARVFPPGGHIANDGRDNSKMVGRSEDAVRVTVQQAAILQTFPPDHPWQGSRSKQFEQVGNAVPPLLAEHILRALLEAA